MHPADRGPKGTFAGAICANGELYCPATPTALLALSPLAKGAGPEAASAHAVLADQAARWRLASHGRDDADGYHRETCPAVAGKLRCPRRPDTMALPYDRPEVLRPPEHPPTCCTQKSITVPPSLNAKTRQKHPYPSPAWAVSYNRRSAAERAFATLKDPASTDINRGWCRLSGLAAITLLLAVTVAARNLRIAAAFDARQAQDMARAARGLPPRTRRRRRRPLAQLANPPP